VTRHGLSLPDRRDKSWGTGAGARPARPQEDAVKLIKAIVRPNKVDDVREALDRMNIPGMTVTEVRGHGRQKGHTAVYRGKEYTVTLLPKVEVEIVVEDDLVDDVVSAVISAARTGEIGDGRVFVLPIEQSYNIRTGAVGL
jgi:nitrogen regulatory protein PII